MKRILFCFITTVSSVAICADIDTNSLSNKSVSSVTEIQCDTSGDEYGFAGTQDAADEYEHHVCDQIKPPKISFLMAMLTCVGGNLFIHYLEMQKLISFYVVELKEFFSNYYNAYTQKNGKKR